MVNASDKRGNCEGLHSRLLLLPSNFINQPLLILKQIEQQCLTPLSTESLLRQAFRLHSFARSLT
jgi:hypothetical protein